MVRMYVHSCFCKMLHHILRKMFPNIFVSQRQSLQYFNFSYFSPCQNHFLFQHNLLLWNVQLLVFVFGGMVTIFITTVYLIHFQQISFLYFSQVKSNSSTKTFLQKASFLGCIHFSLQCFLYSRYSSEILRF